MGWRECCGVEGVLCGGGSVVGRRGCRGAEGVSCGGGSVVGRRECRGAEGVSWDGGSVVGWRRTPLVIVNGNLTGQCYTDNILRPTVLPFLA